LSVFFSPTRFEADILDCVVTVDDSEGIERGVLPAARRLGLCAQFRDEASLSADGYQHVALQERIGRLSGARYVRTDRYCRQIAARRQLYGYYRNPHTDDPQVRDIANPGRRNQCDIPRL